MIFIAGKTVQSAYLLLQWMNKNLCDGLAREGSVRSCRRRGFFLSRTGKCVRAIVVREYKTGFRNPVHRLQLLRGDKGLRTRKQTHELLIAEDQRSRAKRAPILTPRYFCIFLAQQYPKFFATADIHTVRQNHQNIAGIEANEQTNKQTK